MPVGRFRKNPRELDDVEMRVFAAQYPEGSLLFGIGLGLLAAMVAGVVTEIPATTNTLVTGFGPIVGGIAGYLLGHVYKDMRLRQLQSRDASGGGDATLKED